MNIVKMRSLLALAVALIAACLAWLYFDKKEDDLLKRGKLVEVVTAKSYLAAYTRLQPRQLGRTKIPAEYVPLGAVTDPEEIQGQMTLVPFNANEPLFYNKLARNGQNLSNAVPEGKRAFSIPVDKVSGINGLLRPGDLVDVLFINDSSKNGGTTQSATLFQSVQVLAAGELYTEEADKTETNGSVTLALSPEESQLTLFALSHGSVHLSLRPSGDERIVSLGPVNVSELQGRLQKRSSISEPENFTIKKR